MRVELPAPYTREELRDIRHITLDRQQTFDLRNDIFLMRTLVRRNPDQGWDDIEAVLPVRDDNISERALLQKRFLEFQQTRKALRAWEQIYNEDQIATTRGIALSLQIPREIQIQNISFLTNACAVYILPEQMDWYARRLDQQAGITTDNLMQTGAFTDTSQYLENGEGNRCPVVFLPYYWGSQNKEWVKRTQEHEEEHTIFQYYEGTPLASSGYARPNVRVYAADQTREKIGEKYLTDEDMVRKVLKTQVRKMCNMNRLLYYNELVAEGASWPMNENEFERIAGEFDTSRKKRQSVYSRMMEQTMEGIVDALEQTSITEEDKLSIRWDLERQIAEFVLQNYTIGRWMNKLWKSVNGDSERYVSSLYALSPAKPWQVGWFIGENPQALREELHNSPADVDRFAAGQMMFRKIKAIEETQMKPLTETFEIQMENAIRPQIPPEGQANTKEYRKVIQNAYIREYIPAYLQLSQIAAAEAEKLRKQLIDADVIYLPRAVIVPSTEEYLETIFENNTIVEIVVKLLREQRRENEARDVIDNENIKPEKEKNLRQALNKATREIWENAGYDLDAWI